MHILHACNIESGITLYEILCNVTWHIDLSMLCAFFIYIYMHAVYMFCVARMAFPYILHVLHACNNEVELHVHA